LASEFEPYDENRILLASQDAYYVYRTDEDRMFKARETLDEVSWGLKRAGVWIEKEVN
jgi:hypothetical protein